MTTRPPLPPFTRETAIQKVRLAEDGWNSRDPEKVALAYTIDSRWRNRAEFPNGRQEIIEFLTTEVGERTRLSTNQRTVGRTTAIASRCVSPTNGTMIPGIGFAHTATRIGNLLKMD